MALPLASESWDSIDADGFAEMVRFWLANDETRERVARSASITVQPHTFAARAEQLMAQFAPHLDRTLVAAYG